MAKQEKDAFVKPDIKEGLKAIADWYFIVHEETLNSISCDEFLIAADGEVFYSTIKGENAAANYCASNKFGEAKKFKRG